MPNFTVNGGHDNVKIIKCERMTIAKPLSEITDDK